MLGESNGRKNKIKLAEQEQGVVDKLKVIDSRACLLE